MKEWPDEELFGAIRVGEKDALSILFLRYYDPLLHYGLRIKSDRSLVEECIQELFVYLFESSSQLSQVRRVKAYLFKSLRRRIFEKITQKKRLESLHAISLYKSDLLFTSEDMEADHQLNASVYVELLKALNSLPWRQREAIYLRYYNRLSTKEIADIMGAANQTVLNTLYQALKNLRKTPHFGDLVDS